MNLSAAYNYCRRLARRHYENFPVGSLLVPRRLRPHFYALYAYCRVSDDLGDEGEEAGRTRALEAWEEELGEALSGKEAGPVLTALADTASRFDIPHQLFFDLLRAFKQDQEKRRYQSERELLAYCRYSANPVGRMVLYLVRAATDRNLQLSDCVCTGLQLANFCQDVSVDLTKGRVYLPLDEVDQCGYSEAALAAGVQNDAFAGLMRLQCSRARSFLLRGMPLARSLPFRLGLEIRLICLGGLRILEKVEASGPLVLAQRPALAPLDFAGMLVRLAW